MMSARIFNIVKTAVSVFGIAIVVTSCNNTGRDKELRRFYLYESLVDKQEWEELAGLSRKEYLEHGGIFDANYYHLAQAYRGRLVEELFRTRQFGPYGLLFSPREHNFDPCLTHIYFAIGNVAAVQEWATGAYLSDNGKLKGFMLKELVKVEILRGNDKIADKYLKILRKQRKFRKWAENVRKDFEIERCRRCSRTGGYPFLHHQDAGDLMETFKLNPTDSLVMQYVLAWHLLNKDMAAIYGLVERYFGTDIMNSLPTPVQEALIIYYDYRQERSENNDPMTVEWCLDHGVTEETVQRFYMFRDAYIDRNGLALMGYKETFWYYMLLTKV